MHSTCHSGAEETPPNVSVFEAEMRCDWAATEDFARSGDSCSTLRVGGVRLLSSSSAASSCVPVTSAQQQDAHLSSCKALWVVCAVARLLHLHGLGHRPNVSLHLPSQAQTFQGVTAFPGALSQVLHGLPHMAPAKQEV